MSRERHPLVGCIGALVIFFGGLTLFGVLMDSWDPEPLWPKIVVAVFIFFALGALANWFEKNYSNQR